MTPLFLDANVPMYAAGGPHPLREPCREIIRLVVARPSAFFTDAEVLQEVRHRYMAQRLWERGRVIFECFALLMRGRVEAVYARDVEAAAAVAGQCPGLSARDLLHAAVMARVGADHIVSADRGFDRLPQLTRLDPANLPAWREQVRA